MEGGTELYQITFPLRKIVLFILHFKDILKHAPI